jgi:uncharacterized membrane protein
VSLAKQASLRDRVTHMLWICNAMVGVFFAMFGAIILSDNLSYTLHLTVFGMPAGALMAATGASLVLCAIWRIRQER